MWIPVRKHVTLAAKLGIALSSLNAVVKKQERHRKAYKQNVAGSLLQGRALNSHCFKA